MHINCITFSCTKDELVSASNVEPQSPSNVSHYCDALIVETTAGIGNKVMIVVFELSFDEKPRLYFWIGLDSI